jgi:hypothetical protein
MHPRTHTCSLTPNSQTTASVLAYFHAMYLFPEVAQKVYEEIMAVTGGNRMPTIADRPSLPYTEAVWKECFRWNTFVPMVRECDRMNLFDSLTIFIGPTSRQYERWDVERVLYKGWYGDLLQ